MTMNHDSVHERLRGLIREARESCVRPDSAPALVHHVMEACWPRIEGDSAMNKLLAARGLNPEIRTVLKSYDSLQDEGAVSMRDRQIDLWPNSAHDLLRKIDRAAIFVPSRDDFVELVPDALSVDEVREGGLYLIAKGQDCVRRGENLVHLALLIDNTA